MLSVYGPDDTGTPGWRDAKKVSGSPSLHRGAYAAQHNLQKSVNTPKYQMSFCVFPVQPYEQTQRFFLWVIWRQKQNMETTSKLKLIPRVSSQKSGTWLITGDCPVCSMLFSGIKGNLDTLFSTLKHLISTFKMHHVAGLRTVALNVASSDQRVFVSAKTGCRPTDCVRSTTECLVQFGRL